MWFLSLSFSFYKRFLWSSFLLNLVFLGLSFEIPVILILKLLAGVLLWIWYKTEGRNQLVFYNNFRINTTWLLLTCLIFDLLIFFLTCWSFNLVL